MFKNLLNINCLQVGSFVPVGLFMKQKDIKYNQEKVKGKNPSLK